MNGEFIQTLWVCLPELFVFWSGELGVHLPLPCVIYDKPQQWISQPWCYIEGWRPRVCQKVWGIPLLLLVFTRSFIQKDFLLFFLLSIYYVPGMVLDTSDSSVNAVTKAPWFHSQIQRTDWWLPERKSVGGMDEKRKVFISTNRWL